MDYSKSSLIRLIIERGILRFGQFTLKSGRVSPYFFNMGLFYHGDSLQRLGEHYAETLIQHQVDVTHLFGPAYKGIPLVTATAIALAARGKDCTITFNRKEIKDHGEGGLLIGAPLQGNTVLIDDVISAGTAFREAQQIITEQGARLTTVVITLDRCERGLQAQSAIEEIQAQGITVLSLITVHDLIAYLKHEKNTDAAHSIERYLKQYGTH